MFREQTFQYPYEQMNRELQRMKQAYPGRFSLGVAAFSVDGRKIFEVILGDTGAEHHVLIQAGMHGREYLNSAVMVRLLEDYLRCPEWGRYGAWSLKGLYKSCCFHIVPMVNPDGAAISHEGLCGIRSSEVRRKIAECGKKEMVQLGINPGGGDSELQRAFWSRWKANARGVDLNRNFDAGWEEYQGSLKPASEGFKGAFPGSEAETRGLLNIAQKWKAECCVAYHSSGNVIYWDYGSKGTVFEADRRLAGALGKMTGYPPESTVQSGEDAAGCSDYFVLKCGIPAVTIETGAEECPLPGQEFETVYHQNRNLLPELARLFAEKILPCG